MDLQEIQDQLDLNTSIQDNIKNMVKEVYADIYSFLGERQFKKWLIDSHIKSTARRSIYQSLSAREDSYLKKNKNVAGYRTVTTEQRNKIVLRKKVGDNKETTAHETFHALVDGYGGFSAFFGEGITEFMNKTMYNAKTYSYKTNVDVINLLYSMYSDKIIKYYLTRNGNLFFFDLAKELENAPIEVVQERNSELEKSFLTYHNIIYNLDKKEPNELNLAEKEFTKGLNNIMQNYYIYIKMRIENFEYIKDGKVDFDSFSNEMAKVKADGNKLRTNNCFNDLIDILISELIENSHLLENTGENKESIKKNILEAVKESIAYKEQKYTIGLDAKYIKNINQEEEPYKTLNKNQIEKLISKFITNSKEKLTLERKIKILRNIKEATNLSQDELENLIVKEISENCDSKLLYEISRKYTKTMSGIEAIKAENKKDFVTARYVHIELDSMPKTRTYLESKDNKILSLLMIDDKTGEVYKINLNKYGALLPEKDIFVRQYDNSTEEKRKVIPEKLREFENVFQIYSIKTGKSTYIGLNDDFAIARTGNKQNIRIVNGEIDWKVKYIDDVEKEALTKIVFSRIYDKIEEGEYSDCREENGLKTIFYDKFIDDYNTIKENFKDLDKNEEELRYLTGNLLDETFEIKEIFTEGNELYDENIEEEYFQRRELLQRSLKTLIKEKRKNLTREPNEDISYLRGNINSDLYEINSILNNVKNKTKIYEKTPESKFLESAIDATKKVTKTFKIQSQIEQMQLLAQERSKKKFEIKKGDR